MVRLTRFPDAPEIPEIGNLREADFFLIPEHPL